MRKSEEAHLDQDPDAENQCAAAMTELTTTLRALELQLLTTAVRNRADAVDALLADDFLEYGSSGRVWTKAAVIADLRDEPPIERRLSDFVATALAPGVALVTYRVERLGAPAGTAARTLRSSIWVHDGARWRMRFHQGTPTAD